MADRNPPRGKDKAVAPKASIHDLLNAEDDETPSRRTSAGGASTRPSAPYPLDHPVPTAPSSRHSSGLRTTSEMFRGLTVTDHPSGIQHSAGTGIGRHAEAVRPPPGMDSILNPPDHTPGQPRKPTNQNLEGQSNRSAPGPPRFTPGPPSRTSTGGSTTSTSRAQGMDLSALDDPQGLPSGVRRPRADAAGQEYDGSHSSKRRQSNPGASFRGVRPLGTQQASPFDTFGVRQPSGEASSQFVSPYLQTAPGPHRVDQMQPPSHPAPRHPDDRSRVTGSGLGTSGLYPGSPPRPDIPQGDRNIGAGYLGSRPPLGSAWEQEGVNLTTAKRRDRNRLLRPEYNQRMPEQPPLGGHRTDVRDLITPLERSRPSKAVPLPHDFQTTPGQGEPPSRLAYTDVPNLPRASQEYGQRPPHYPSAYQSGVPDPSSSYGMDPPPPPEPQTPDRGGYGRTPNVPPQHRATPHPGDNASGSTRGAAPVPQQNEQINESRIHIQKLNRESYRRRAIQRNADPSHNERAPPRPPLGATRTDLSALHFPTPQEQQRRQREEQEELMQQALINEHLAAQFPPRRDDQHDPSAGASRT